MNFKILEMRFLIVNVSTQLVNSCIQSNKIILKFNYHLSKILPYNYNPKECYSCCFFGRELFMLSYVILSYSSGPIYEVEKMFLVLLKDILYY